MTIRHTNLNARIRRQIDPINEQTGTTYTLQLADDNGLVDMNNASGQTVTVPPNSSVPFRVGAQVLVRQKGAGQVTISAGAGVTVNLPDGANLTRVQQSVAVLVKTAADEWLLAGDVTS